MLRRRGSVSLSNSVGLVIVLDTRSSCVRRRRANAAAFRSHSDGSRYRLLPPGRLKTVQYRRSPSSCARARCRYRSAVIVKPHFGQLTLPFRTVPACDVGDPPEVMLRSIPSFSGVILTMTPRRLEITVWFINGISTPHPGPSHCSVLAQR